MSNIDLIEIPTEFDWKLICTSFKQKILEKFNTPEYMEPKLCCHPFYLLFAQDNEKLNFCSGWNDKLIDQIKNLLNEWLNKLDISNYRVKYFEISKEKYFVVFIQNNKKQI